MVIGIIDQAVIGKDDALRSACTLAQRVDIALFPGTSLGFGEQAFVVAEEITADTHTREVFFQTAAGPAGFPCFFLGDEVGGKMPVLVQIQRNIFLGGIAAVLREQFFLVFGGDSCGARSL